MDAIPGKTGTGTFVWFTAGAGGGDLAPSWLLVLFGAWCIADGAGGGRRPAGRGGGDTGFGATYSSK